MLDDTTELLNSSWQEAWYVSEGDDGDLESIAESHESSTLYRGINIEATSQNVGLVSNNTNYASFNITESNDNIFGIFGHDLVEVIAINNVLDDMLHVIGLVRIEGNNIVQQVSSRLVLLVLLGPYLVRTLCVA